MKYDSRELSEKAFVNKVREISEQFVKWAMAEFGLEKDDASAFCLKISVEYSNNKTSCESPDKYNKDIAFKTAYLEYARLVKKADKDLKQSAVA